LSELIFASHAELRTPRAHALDNVLGAYMGPTAIRNIIVGQCSIRSVA
jgi:hypothetical protein